MLFSSLEFLFLFLPLTIAVYYLVPKCARNAVLLLFSLVFYAFGEPVYLILMIGTIVVDWLFGLSIERYAKTARAKRLLLALAVTVNILSLAFFKYYDLVASALPFRSPLGLSLPIGISFYTFQALTYVIDIYRKSARAAISPMLPATYITLFPQLIAGPIVKYNDIEGELLSRSHSLSSISDGTRRFIIGLAKKVLLANSAGEMFESLARGSSAYGQDTLGAWLCVIFFAFQIYFDFSGYSDMAIGLGKLFGFTFPENFSYPYIASSITDFWRRWHITLSSFFRDYLYIPLGGSRQGRLRTYLNLLIVWSATGIWHGAGINFLLWGLYFFLLLSAEKLFLHKLLEKLPKLVRHGYALVAILFGWLIFAADGISLTKNTALTIARAMLFISAPLSSSYSLYELKRNLLPLIVMSAASLPVFSCIGKRLLNKSAFGRAISNFFCLGLFIICIAYLVSSGYNPFLYFRF